MISLEHVLDYKQLGKIIDYSGDQLPDIQNRIAEADTEYFRLSQLWKGHRLTLRHRLKLFRNYQSIVRYGSHNWFLTDKVKAKLTGWAARRLSPIVDCRYPVKKHNGMQRDRESDTDPTDRGGDYKIQGHSSAYAGSRPSNTDSTGN